MQYYMALTLVVIGLTAFGQTGGVTLHVNLEQEQFISGEDVVPLVRITNRAGQTLALGADNQWLTFEIEKDSGMVVPKLSDPVVKGDFLLPSSKTATKRVNLAPHFNFREPGRYLLTAYVRIPGADKPLVSKPVPFDIFSGTQLLDFVVGVPPAFSGKNSKSETRRYVLQQSKNRKELKLYFRLAEEPSGRTLKVFPIATMLSFSRPEAQVDQYSNLHVLTQVGAHSFLYCMLNPDGQLLARRTYDYAQTRPTLKLGSDGRAFVTGGIQKITPTDLPPPTVNAEAN